MRAKPVDRFACLVRMCSDYRNPLGYRSTREYNGDRVGVREPGDVAVDKDHVEAHGVTKLAEQAYLPLGACCMLRATCSAAKRDTVFCEF